jgi:CheY-like chemotaxis protein
MHRQEAFVSSRQTGSRNGANDCLLMDGVQSNLVAQAASISAQPIITNGKTHAQGSILLLDDQRLTRECISEALQELCPDLSIWGLRLADYHRHEPCGEALLIIVNLHGARIGEAVQRLRHDGARPPSPLLFITARDERSETPDALEHGAMGLVRADVRIELLIAAVRLVIAGGRYYPAQAHTFPAPAAKDFP